MASVQITILLYNGPLLCGFNVPIEGLMCRCLIGCQSVSRDTSGRLHLTCLEYAGDSTLYVGTSSGHVSAWDTRQNTCFMHWQADADSTHEIGCPSLSLDVFPLL